MLDSANDRQAERDRPFWIKITGQATGTNRYSWEQVNDASTSFGDVASGFRMSGTTSAWSAYEIAGRTDVPVGTKVLATVSASGTFWIFRYGESDDGGWLASLATDSCLLVTVLSASGICAEVPIPQGILLAWDAGAGAWVSSEDFEVETGTSPMSFWLEGGTAHLQLDGFVYELFREGGGDSYLIFSGGGPTLCNGTPTEECGDNRFRVRVECVCCPAQGYTIPAWYCGTILPDTCGTGPVVCLDYTTTVPCADTVTICGGPFASQTLCLAGCTVTPSTGGTSALCSRTLPATLTATLGSGEGTMALTWNGGAARYEGSKALTCGETLRLRYDPALDADPGMAALTYSCDGVNWFSPHGGSKLCGPPYTVSVACDMDEAAAGCAAGSCGVITVDIAE